MTPLNLTKATKIKRLVFRCTWPNVQWVTTALQTVESKNLHRITVRPDANTPVYTFTEQVRQQWQDLDHLLVQFRTSNSIHSKIVYETGDSRKDIRDHVPSLLLVLTRRGLIDLVKYDH